MKFRKSTASAKVKIILNVNKKNSAVYPWVAMSDESHSSGLHVVSTLALLIGRKLDAGLNAEDVIIAMGTESNS